MLRRLLILIILQLPFLIGLAQTTSFTLSLMPQLNSIKIVPDSCTYKVGSNDSISISQLKFYLSNAVWFKAGKQVYAEPNSFYLLDLSDEQSMKIKFIIPATIEYDSFGIFLGIDSSTNVSGAMGGALDPINGMYWTWQSGYINIKLEGKWLMWPGDKGDIRLHLGGYLAPFYALQLLKFPIHSNESRELNVLLNLNPVLMLLREKGYGQVMSPSGISVELSKIFKDAFSRLP